MTYEFIVERHPSGDNRQRLSREEMLARLTRYSRGSWLFRVRNRGQDWSRLIGRREMLNRVRYRTWRGDEDFKMFVKRRRDRRVLSIHKVEEIPDIPNFSFGCHPQIERAYELLAAEYGRGGFRNGGIYYCRYVDGTRTVSYHGHHDYPRWRGAAGDIFSDPDTMYELVERAKYLRRMCREGKLHLDRIIVGATYWWSKDNFAEPHYYSGIYHRHIHIEVWSGRACSP